jgi:hypothetical protein
MKWIRRLSSAPGFTSAWMLLPEELFELYLKPFTNVRFNSVSSEERRIGA